MILASIEDNKQLQSASITAFAEVSKCGVSRNLTSELGNKIHWDHETERVLPNQPNDEKYIDRFDWLPAYACSNHIARTMLDSVLW